MASKTNDKETLNESEEEWDNHEVLKKVSNFSEINSLWK